MTTHTLLYNGIKLINNENDQVHHNENMSLGDLLAINLLVNSNDVEEVCDQAAKEDKMETTLQQISDRWSSIDLIMTPHHKIDGDLEEDVPLLGIGEDEFELLENDQLVIQGMMASRYLAQFESEVNDWQKALFNVNEVFLLIGDIQRTWSYLEPLFIHSDEVKRELPEDGKCKDKTMMMSATSLISYLLPTLNILYLQLSVLW